MCAWNSISPDGTKSVKLNKTIIQANTTYTETELNKDHFWNIGANEDGRHKFVNTPATNQATPAIGVNAPLATGMDLLYFSRLKTAIEATVQQDCQPFVKNKTAVGEVSPWSLGILQLLGARAICVFNCTGIAPVQGDLVYSHNIKAITGVPATDGVDRNADGTYTIRFNQALPSDNYLVFGGAMINSPNTVFEPVLFSVSCGATIPARKSGTQVVIVISLPSGTLVDPMQFWLACIGG